MADLLLQKELSSDERFRPCSCGNGGRKTSSEPVEKWELSCRQEGGWHRLEGGSILQTR
ncbi:Hypothetical predicted protein, partial [Paramuricea clavata]